MLAKEWPARYFIFALIGVPLVLAGLLAPKPEGIRSTPNTLVLYVGLACCLVQIVIWLGSLVLWSEARRASREREDENA